LPVFQLELPALLLDSSLRCAADCQQRHPLPLLLALVVLLLLLLLLMVLLFLVLLLLLVVLLLLKGVHALLLVLEVCRSQAVAACGGPAQTAAVEHAGRATGQADTTNPAASTSPNLLQVSRLLDVRI
jgi:hypothetical protein